MSTDARKALEAADARVQDVEQLAVATLTGVRALLAGPDSVAMRMGIMTLVERLARELADVMGDINADAEQCGVNFVDASHETMHKAFLDAVRAKGPAHPPVCTGCRDNFPMPAMHQHGPFDVFDGPVIRVQVERRRACAAVPDADKPCLKPAPERGPQAPGDVERGGMHD